jgi:hypothetical protein
LKPKTWQQVDNEDPNRPNDLVVLYAYHETPIARENAEFFIRHGLHDNADFVFIFNGETYLDELLPKNRSNIRVVRRTNDCFDMGSYGAVLMEDNKAMVKRYKRFILMNSSIRGPFIPDWSIECWSDAFMNKITRTVKVRRPNEGSGNVSCLYPESTEC